MKTVCKQRECTGCKACINICPKSCIVIQDNLSYFDAIIDGNKCIECNLCQNVCPSIHYEELMPPIEWKQGWSKNESIRLKASSGGIASAVVLNFLQNEGVVYACVFKNGEFNFDRINKKEDVFHMRGSKYIKSNPDRVFLRVLHHLQNNEKVLFIGLPCQVQAVKNFIKAKIIQKMNNLYTIDLVCHGSPSPYILKKFLKENKISIKDITEISFRNKTKFELSLSDKRGYSHRLTDEYMVSFLTGLSYTENCYQCKFAQLQRSGDVTLGDSWGSDLSLEEQKKGISLIMCQTQKGLELINNSDIYLTNVNKKNAIAANHQLEYPSKKPERYAFFWKGVKKGLSFKKIILICYPKQGIKSALKRIIKW